MGELTGKVAVITGASSRNGIGQAIARRYARAGASVYLMAEGSAEQLRDNARECRELSPESAARFEFGVHDLAQSGVAEAMIEKVAQLFGRIDILVNNAGVRARLKFGEFSRDVFNNAVAVNLAAPFFACQAVAPIMRRQGGGRIIHIASQMGVVTHERRAVYGMTKAALIHLAKAMAFELAPDGIMVNAISPGWNRTERMAFNLSKIPGLDDWVKKQTPLGRWSDPLRDLGGAAVYFASDASDFVTGQTLQIEGGMTSTF